uniref:Signaling mucin HKR1 n=1 Tax=Zeugodacus cucurbitae TaxID=28588 RepID=A0A0A1WD38_ZEUCU
MMQKNIIILLVAMLAVQLVVAEFNAKMKYVNQPNLVFGKNPNKEDKSEENKSSKSSDAQDDYFEPPPDSQGMDIPTTYSQEGLPPPRKPLPDTFFDPQYEAPITTPEP